jgi:hypothetical protein
MKNLLLALNPTLPSAVEQAAEVAVPDNVYRLRFPEKGPTGDVFTAEERTQLRAMLKDWEAIKAACPVARNACKK